MPAFRRSTPRGNPSGFDETQTFEQTLVTGGAPQFIDSVAVLIKQFRRESSQTSMDIGKVLRPRLVVLRSGAMVISEVSMPLSQNLIGVRFCDIGVGFGNLCLGLPDRRMMNRRFMQMF